MGYAGGAPLHIGGIPLPWREETILALEIPGGLSWLAYGRTGAVVTGLKVVPPADRPNVVLVHLAFQLMVAIGFGLLGLGPWAGVVAAAPGPAAGRPVVPASGRRRRARRRSSPSRPAGS